MMKNEPDISVIAALIGEPTRARMMTALMGGKALTATELATEADIGTSTASSHLTKLVDKELLVVRKQGRHKYFQLQSREIASLIESLLNLSAQRQQSSINTGPKDDALRNARVCYDHLAGEIAVQLFDVLKAREFLVNVAGHWMLSELGTAFFKTLGFNEHEYLPSKRPLCKACLDWSERRDHLAGTLGQWILNDVFNRGWGHRTLDSRAITFTDSGLKQFRKHYQFQKKDLTR